MGSRKDARLVRLSTSVVLAAGIGLLTGCGAGPADPLGAGDDAWDDPVGKADGFQNVPYCGKQGTAEEGWYWSLSRELIKLERCAGMGDARCVGIGWRFEGWVSDDGPITYAPCHRAVGIALEGEPCGTQTGAGCSAEWDLWCDTQAAETGICRRNGSCETDLDCERPENQWSHVRCMGHASCEQGRCAWHCGEADGPWSWTTVMLQQIESLHSYGEDTERTWTIHREGAARIQLHFDKIDLEPGYDWLVIESSSEEDLIQLTGTHRDLWTREFDGDTVTITLVTDSSINAWGFSADQVSFFERIPLGRCNRQQDCEPGLVCLQLPCYSPYEPCYGDCVADET